MLSYIKLAGVVIAVATLIVTHLYVYNAGKDKILAKLKTDQIEIYKAGKKVDSEVFNADDTRLCDLLGGCQLLIDENSNKSL